MSKFLLQTTQYPTTNLLVLKASSHSSSSTKMQFMKLSERLSKLSGNLTGRGNIGAPSKTNGFSLIVLHA